MTDPFNSAHSLEAERPPRQLCPVPSARRRVQRLAAALLACALLLEGGARCVLATEEEAQAEPRPTGLPGASHWTFHLAAGLGAFGFANSLYANPKADASGNLSDNWFESYLRAGASADFPISKGEFYGQLSAIGERTFSAPPPLVGGEASSFQFEDLYVGWRSGTSVGSSENELDFSIGRQPYKLGHGMIVWDGAADGGSRGGYWSNPRTAWAFATLARFKPGNHTLEGFYIVRDDIPSSQTDSKAWGVNYEYAWGEHSTFGATYMKWSADEDVIARRNGERVFDARAYTSPFHAVPDLSFELEAAFERNGDLNHSYAWNALAAYELSGVTWKPRFSYRYAIFSGDDPDTPADEAFDPLYTGFYDWGSWWQGEIAGEYFLSNSNLISHQARLNLTMSDQISGGAIAYLFRLDYVPAASAGVTSRDLAFEVDTYCDWKINTNFSASVLAAWAEPQKAVEQEFGRNDNFVYGMLYLTYTY